MKANPTGKDSCCRRRFTGLRHAAKRIAESGYDVMAAYRDRQAMPLYKKEPADLLITDILMREQEGLETIQEFRRNIPGLKIIAYFRGRKRRPIRLLRTAKLFRAERTLANLSP